MKNKLRTINQETQLLALDFLDYSIDDGKIPLWTQVSSKDFLGSLVNLLKTRDAPEVSTKILYLIAKWGKKFEKHYSIIPNFTDTYKHLKNSGVNFPEGITSTYSQYLMSEDDLNEYNQHSIYNNNNFDDEGNINIQRNNSHNPYIDIVCVNLKPSNYKSKYKKLVDKLNEWTYNIAQINQIIDNMVPGRTNKYCDGLVENIRKGSRQLIETIQSDKLKDEELMEIALKVNEDIKNTINRYEQVKKKLNVGPFVSAFQNQDQQINNVPKFDNTTKQREVQNTQQSQTHANLLDIFGDNNNNNNIQQSQQQNQNRSNVNDLFDIFGSGNTNTNTNQPNMGINMDKFNNNNNAINVFNSNNNNNMSNNLMDLNFMSNNQPIQTNFNPNLMSNNYSNNNNNNNGNNILDFNLMNMNSNQNSNSNIFPSTNMNSNQNIFGGIEMPSFDQSNNISPKTDMLAQRINLAYNDPKQMPIQTNIPQNIQNNNNNNFLNMNANTITTSVGASTVMANNNYNFSFNNNNPNVTQQYPPQQIQNQFQNNNFNYNNTNNNNLNSLF